MIKREHDRSISFASLQSAEGQQVLKHFGLDTSSVDSIVLIKDNKAYVKSRAFFQIVKHLKLPWPALGFFAVLPLKFTDAVYDFIAKNRYKLMGKKDSCWLPSENMSSRFIDSAT